MSFLRISLKFVVLAQVIFVEKFALSSASLNNSDVIYIGVLGDSLSTGFNAVSSENPQYRPGDQPAYNWVTGNGQEYQFKSIAQRLQALFPNKTIKFENAATISKESKDLMRQIRRLRVKATSRKMLYDLITIGIGGNDLCHYEDPFEGVFERYEQSLREAIGAIVEGDGRILTPNGKVLILEVPNLYNIWRMFFDFKTKSTALPEKYSWVRTCASKWSLGQIGSFKICSPLFGRDPKDFDNRERYPEMIARAEKFFARWKKINELIHKVAEEFPLHVVYHPPRYPESDVNWDFGWEHVSPIDCFHPSIQGQSLIAERAWIPSMFDDWKSKSDR